MAFQAEGRTIRACTPWVVRSRETNGGIAQTSADDFVQAAESVGDDKTLRLGFFNRKANLGPNHRPVGYLVNFSDNRTEYRRVDVADTPELAEKLTIRQRMQHLLKRGARTPDEIATALDVKVDSVRKVVDRDKQGKRQCFLVLEGGRVGLKEQSA